MTPFRTRLAYSAAAAALALPLGATPALAVDGGGPVLSGLHSPRGVAVAANGDVYVAEAGSGGATVLGDGTKIGATGRITSYRPSTGASTVLAGGFVSAATGEGVLGLGALSTQGSTVYAIVGGAPQVLTGVPSSPDVDLARAQLGQLVKVSAGGAKRFVAGLGSFDFDWTATQPGLVDPPDGTQDANPYGVLSTPGRVLVADAGANTVAAVRPNGRVSILTEHGVPHDGPTPVSDAVPTCVASDGSGGFLVGTLDRQMLRMAADGTLTSVPLSGDPLHTIGGCTGDGHGGMYAVDTASFFLGQPGSVVHIGHGGHITTIRGGLFAPGGVAVAKDGSSLFVTVGAVSPTDGALIEVPLP